MDTSEKYILMCEKAQEIQKLFEFRERDCCFGVFETECIEDSGIFYISRCQDDFYSTLPVTNKERVWLPRQDQLQEMVMKDSINIELNRFFVFSLEKRYNWHSDFEYPVFAAFRFDTFEQLWLAYVMKCKFSKTWSEEKQDWI